MVQVNIHEAKTHLSRLLARVAEGEEVIIARSGKPVARLTRLLPTSSSGRILGRDAGVLEVPADFDDPLPDDLLERFHA